MPESLKVRALRKELRRYIESHPGRALLEYRLHAPAGMSMRDVRREAEAVRSKAVGVHHKPRDHPGEPEGAQWHD